MASRGQKRTEAVDVLPPADKRACNSVESRPSTSNSQVSSVPEGQEADMDAVSYTSGSTRSDGEGERDSTYGSCESDYSLREYYGHRATEDHSRFQKVLSSLSESVNDSEQLALLTELCDLLSFASDSSLSSQVADSFAPVLVKLVTHANIPDIMLLSIRAITYLCDANPRSSGFLVRHDAVPAICQRLMVIEYLDVAEQCLQALQKISYEQPLACLQSGAIMAVLSYIDFFATSVQRVALSTVVNICKKLSPESSSLFMDAVPSLCNLLQYEDKQLVESVVSCLIRIGEQVSHSSELLDEICKQGLVQHALHLIGLNSRTSLSQTTYIGLIGLLVKLTSGSTLAFKTLFELNISDTVKDMLCSHHVSHGTQTISMVDGHHGQVHEVLKLLNELLPKITAEEEGQLKSDKENYLLDHPDILQNFGVELLPNLIQVVNSGVNLFVCYCALSVINKLVHFSKADALQSLLKAANFSSFLAGVLLRKDHHVILLALQIVDAIMLKLPHVFLNSFIREGVLFSIHALLAPDNGLKLSPVFDDMRLENDENSACRDLHRCPCFAFDTVQSSKSPVNVTCKLQKEMVHNLASRIWTTYFEAESLNPDKGVTDALRSLRELSSALTALVNKSPQDASSSHKEEDIDALLHQIMLRLNDRDSISTFEFVESGIITALVSYLSYGSHHVGTENTGPLNTIDKRFEAFGRLLLSSTDQSWEEFPIMSLTRRLQRALSSVENFPIISSHTSKMRSSYATVPYGRRTSYPSLRVNFMRETEEDGLCDYDEDVVHVDPFCPLDAIEGYLWPIVSSGNASNLNVDPSDLKEKDMSSPNLATDSNGSQSKTADDMVVSTETLDIHKLEDPTEQVERGPETSHMITDRPEGEISDDDAKPKLHFYLEGKKLNNQLTLYQCILEKQLEVEHYNSTSSSLWTHTYKITYRRNVSSPTKKSDAEAQCSPLSKQYSFCQSTSFTPEVFVSEAYLKKLGSVYDMLFLLKSLEEINRSRLHLISGERTYAYAEGRTDDLDKLNVPIHEVSQTEFVNTKLTEKLEQQLRDPMTVSVGSMPAWCTQLMAWCPFLFGFEARYKFFYLAALSRLPHQTHTSSHPAGGGSSARQHHGNSPRRKFLVHRDKILESATKMMETHASEKVLEVEYSEEVGTGLGPTLEFYTLVCREFQRSSLGMWRENHDLEADGFVVSPFGLFPRPWSPLSSTTHSVVIEKFGLLGKIVAKALQDGRILDLPFSKAFYKLILGKELSVFDIQSIDPTFGRVLLEFQAIVERKKYVRSLCKETSPDLDVCFRNSKIEDLCLDFTLPGYPDYVDVSSCSSMMVNLDNLEEYVTLMVDGTINSGINKQVEAFKSGFDQVFPIRHLMVFTEEELERLMCGDHVQWNSDELVDHVKFDHGYTVSSSPIVNLLEIMQEFDREQQRAFLQFVTGAPRLPPGGLASLNPKLTIVRKHCGNCIDADLPSVMTCANYLKLPPYSSKQVMKEKLLYAITEGQGSFHLS